MKIGFKTILSLLILVIVAFITHKSWFQWNTIISYSDFLFRYDDLVKTLDESFKSWISYYNFGYPNIQPYWYPIRGWLWSQLAKSGISFINIIKITHLIPIAILGFVSPYFLSWKISNNHIISVIAALVYGASIHFLIRQQMHLAIAFVMAVAPLIFILIFYFIKNQNRYTITSLIFGITFITLYEARITYIVILALSIVIFIELLYNSKADSKKLVINLIISGVIFTLLNSFWLFLLSDKQFIHNINLVAQRATFGDHLYNINYAFTIFDHSWTGSKPELFVTHTIPFYLWFLPFMAFLPLVFPNKAIKKQHYIISALIISLFGIFLTKQSGVPIKMSYEFIRAKLPLFYLFRSASKFYLLTMLGYLILITYSLIVLYRKSFNYVAYISLFLLTCLSIFNLYPMAMNKIHMMLEQRHIPNDYIKAKNNLFTNTDVFFRTLWVPAYSRWGFYSSTHPMIHMIGILSKNWRVYLPTDNHMSPISKIQFILSQQFSNQLLDVSSIKYVIIPIQDIANDDDFFKYYGPREEFIKIVENTPYLQKIDIGTKELLVFENKDFRPHIYTTPQQETVYKDIPYQQINFQYVNPTQYKVNLKDISQPLYLNFSENFHPEWEIRVGDFKWYQAFGKNYFIDNKYHFKNDAGLNSFYIDPQTICQKFSCTQNPNGSYNLKLTLYFKPQSYMNLGLVISGTTLVLILGYLGYSLALERRNKIKRSA